MWQRADIDFPLACLDKHCATLLNDKIVLFCGSGGGESSAVRQLRMNEEQELETVSTHRCPDLIHLQVTATPSDSIIGFGGWDERDCLSDQLTMFNEIDNSFSLLDASGDNPTPREGHSFFFNQIDQTLCLFGGNTNDGIDTTVYQLDFSYFCWSIIAPSSDEAPQTSFHSTCVFNDQVFFFGGTRDNGEQTNELHSFHLGNKEWRKYPDSKFTPSSRSKHFSFRVDNFLVILGGTGPNGVLKDGGIFDTACNTWMPLPICLNLPITCDNFTVHELDTTIVLFSRAGCFMLPKSSLYKSLPPVFNPIEGGKVTIPASNLNKLCDQLNILAPLLYGPSIVKNPTPEAIELAEVLKNINKAYESVAKSVKQRKPKTPKVQRNTDTITSTTELSEEPKSRHQRRQSEDTTQLEKRLKKTRSAKRLKNLLSPRSASSSPSQGKRREPETQNLNISEPMTHKLPCSSSPKLQISNPVNSKNLAIPVRPERSPRSRLVKESTPAGSISPKRVQLPEQERFRSRTLSPMSPRTLLKEVKSLPPAPKPPNENSSDDIKKNPKLDVPMEDQSETPKEDCFDENIPKMETSDITPRDESPRHSASCDPTTTSSLGKSVDSATAAAIAELDMFSKGGQVWKRKKKKKTLSNWKQRYFHLKGGRIFYYSSVSDVKPLGDFDLVVTQVKRIDHESSARIKDSSQYKYVFQLSTFGSEYHIATETEEELLQWLNMVNRVKEHIFAHGIRLGKPSQRPKPKKNIGSRLSLRGRKQATIDPSQVSISANPGFFTPPTSSGFKGREAVLEEIMTTERDYVHDLCIVKDHFIFKLEDYGLMQKDQKDAIFGNIEELIPLHQELLEKLEAEYEQDKPNFGVIFTEVAPKFTIYSNYCSSQSSASETVEEYSQQNPNFGLCLDELKTHESVKGLDLKDYLIKPMQRVCKYPLLLRELLKETEESDPSYPQISTAFDMLQEYLSVVNENKRTVDNLMDLIAVQDLIVDKQLSLQAKGRCLVTSKEFKKVFLEPNSSPVKLTIWLFSDMLLIAKKKDKDKFLYRAQVNTNSCVVWDLDPQGSAGVDRRHGFSIVNTDKRAAHDKIIILAASAEEKLEWINLVNESIGSLL